MKPTPLVPAVPGGRGAPRWSLAASVALHGLLLAAALLIVTQPPLPSGGAESSFQLVFQPPAGGAPSPPPDAAKTQPLPPAQPADMVPPPDAEPGIPASAPLTAPDPAVANSPPPPEAATAEPVPSPAPSPALPTPAAPSPAPTVAAPSSSSPPPVVEVPPDPLSSLPIPLDVAPGAEPPAVRLELPPTDAAPPAPEPIMPQPPPPLPTPAPRPQPRPSQRPSSRQAFGTLANPMDLSLAPSAARPAARGLVASRSLDLSPPTERQGPVKSDPYAQIRAANASADWNRGLLQYWLSHRYYPEQAAAEGDEGEVTIQLTVNRSGRVENVEIVSKSGSQWLDMAALGTWRNARLPAFTSEMREDRITFPIPIHYYLTRR